VYVPDILPAMDETVLGDYSELHPEFGAFSVIKQECDDCDCDFITFIVTMNQPPIQTFELTSLHIADRLALARGLELS
jgi:hypothetical protein